MTIFNVYVNYIDLGIVALIVAFAWAGCRKGLFINVLNFIRWSVGLFLCFYFSENLAQQVCSTYVKPEMHQFLSDKLSQGGVENVLALVTQVQNEVPKPFSQLISIDGIALTEENIVDTVLETVFEPLLLIATKAAIFIAVFILFFAITGIILHFVKKSNKKKDKEKSSKLRKADRAFGFILGVFKGAIVVFTVCEIIKLVTYTSEDTGYTNAFLEAVSTSTLFEFVDSINPFNAVTEGIL
ncbi:MAG: CvpA family protein [Eubacterium sp.]|nr:CvpA family protein [Eubacterium sp.]